MADREIRHLESVLNAARHLNALAQSRCLDASYWVTRAYELADKNTLLASQQNRVTALARAFEAHALAAVPKALHKQPHLRSLQPEGSERDNPSSTSIRSLTSLLSREDRVPPSIRPMARS